MNPIYAVLRDPEQGAVIMKRIWPEAKAALRDGHTLELSIYPERRSKDQNAKFHAICEDLERARVEWAGKPRDAGEWKVLLISGHSVATKDGAEIIPGLEGEFVNIRESSARMSKSRTSSLIEYTLAFCAAKGVKLRAEPA